MKKYGSLRKGDLREFQYHILLAISFLLCSFLEVEFLIVVFFSRRLTPDGDVFCGDRSDHRTFFRNVMEIIVAIRVNAKVITLRQ